MARTLARSVVLLGAALSLVLMARTGHQQKSLLLIAMFTAWVLTPFAALLALDWYGSGWPVTSRKVVYILMVVVGFASPLVYAMDIRPAHSGAAFPYLMVPFIAVGLIVATGMYERPR